MLDDSISIYNLNCELERKVTPKSAKEKKDVVILDFAWSNYHQRVSFESQSELISSIVGSNDEKFYVDILGISR